jgi:hypothetical protein
MSVKTVVIITFITGILSGLHALEFSPGLVAFSGGSWIALPVQKSPLYFSKAAATWYMTIAGYKAVAGVPIAWTYESGSNRQRLFPGDGTLYIGKPIGQLQPRLGIIVPLGYGASSTWKKEAWIGTNNFKVQAGLAYGRSEDELEGMPLTIEAMVSTPLTEENSFTKQGSFSGIAFAKTYWRLSDLFRYGAELLATSSYTIWDWTYEARPGVWENVRESAIGVVPHLWVEHKFASSWYCSLKGGFGPQYKQSNQYPGLNRSGNSLNLSLGLQWYP